MANSFVFDFSTKNTDRYKTSLSNLEKGLTQTWLWEKLGKSYNIANPYAKSRRQPSIKILLDIAKLLKICPREL